MVRLPTNRQRLALVGRTGSGKTLAALWHLSKRNLEKRPWVVYDYKADEHINGIARAKHITTDFVPKPKDTGVFIVHPLPKRDDAAVERQMWRLWERGGIGVYVDEGYMIDNDAFNAILTQGRSREIPAIVLSQRPVWMPRFVFSEADFYQVFDLNDRRDQQTVEAFAPVNFEKPLPPYHSFYFDVGKKQLVKFKPVPPEDVILGDIDIKLKPKRVML